MRLIYLCGWGTGTFWKSIIDGISDFCRINQIEIIHMPVEPEEDDKSDKYLPVIKNIIKTGFVDGVIISPNMLEGNVKHKSTFIKKVVKGIPVVGLSVKLSGIPMVSIENTEGIKLMMRHMIIQHKRRRILFINLLKGQYESEIRYQAYRDSLHEAGISLDRKLIKRGGITRRDGLNAIREVLQKKIDFDAVMCNNDELAIGVMEGLEEVNIQVPEEVSICGFDNIDIAATFIPALTSIRQPGYELGLKAASMLHSFITQKIPMKDSSIPARQIIRQSCGCLPREKEYDLFKQGIESSAAIRNKEQTADFLKQQMLKWMQSLQKGKNNISAELLSGLYTSLIDDLNTGKNNFLDRFNRMLVTQVAQGEYITVWKKILPLMLETSRHNARINQFSNERAANILRRAQLILLEWLIVDSSSNITQAEFIQYKTSQFRNRILHVENGNDLKRCLTIFLPLLGIRNLYFILYSKTTKKGFGVPFPKKARVWYVLQDGRPYPIPLSEDFYYDRLFPPHIEREENDKDYFMITLARNDFYWGYCLIQKEEKTPLSTLYGIKDYIQYAVKKIDMDQLTEKK